MKILMINKFLYPKGGAETYTLKLGEYLISQGHEVQYFGMNDEKNCVGNNAGMYTSEMDFHNDGVLSKISYSLKTIYSFEARRKIRAVLDDFQPNVCHLNNFNFQLTPSIIVEIRKWEKESGHKCKIVVTAHDSQLVCPNHLMQNPITGKACTKCLDGSFVNCIKGKCVHCSMAKSIGAVMEVVYWNLRKIYDEIDVIISPSEFISKVLSTNNILKSKIIVLRNFIEKSSGEFVCEKKDYVLFFGRYSEEKGIKTLIKVANNLPDLKFVFAGSGPLEDEINKVSNITNKGFLQKGELEKVIKEASLTIMCSECFENCPFSVMESQMYGTPVLGVNMGGVPELIEEGKTGELFESGNAHELQIKIMEMLNNKEKLEMYSENCKAISYDDISEYCTKLLELYR